MKLANYRYLPPMPLENTSTNYFYCATGGLPPLPPRNKKVNSRRANNNDKNNNKNNNNNNNTTELAATAVNMPTVTNTPTVPTSILRSAGTTTSAINTGRRVHWPDDLDQHKQVVEFNKADAKFASIIGSPFEGEWYYDALEYAPCTSAYNPPLAPRKERRTINNTGGAVLPLDHEDSAANPFCYGMGMENEKEEDNGSDYYFSFPSTTCASVSADDYFTSMSIFISVEAEEEG